MKHYFKLKEFENLSLNEWICQSITRRDGTSSRIDKKEREMFIVMYRAIEKTIYQVETKINKQNRIIHHLRATCNNQRDQLISNECELEEIHDFKQLVYENIESIKNIEHLLVKTYP